MGHGPIERVLLRSQTRRRILDDIIGGELPAGAPAAERQIADALGVSRTPVREALLALECEGHLERCDSTLGLRVASLSRSEAAFVYPAMAGLEKLVLARWVCPEQTMNRFVPSRISAWLN